MPSSFAATNRVLLLAGCSLATLLAGCSTSSNSISINSYAQTKGNWQFSSSAPAAALPALGGTLSVTDGHASGILHPLASSSPALCVGTKTSFPVSGPVDSKGHVTLTSSGFSGGALTLTGTIAANQRSLTDATFMVANGGACAMASTPVVAAQYTPVTGTYVGIIHSDSGFSLPVTTVFTQTSDPDSNGTYHLQGNAGFGNSQTCFSSPAVTDSAVTGSTLSATYSETRPGTGTSTVTVSGTFNTDATTLTLTNYTISGGDCSGDTGSGVLTRQ